MSKETKEILLQMRIPFLIVAIMWLVKIYEVFNNTRFTRWGIFPRESDGLIGILTGPFVHSNWQHLFANSLPLFMMMSIILVFYKKVAAPTFFIVTFFTGFAVWLFARESYHVGASGVVYGLISFVAFSGLFRRNIKSIVLAMVMMVIYSSYFAGIVPTEERISWESHLFGALVGIVVAFVFKSIREEDEEIVEQNPWAGEQKAFFFPRDIFDKTKQQRYLEALAAQQAQQRAEEE